jgi:hypothetical protein
VQKILKRLSQENIFAFKTHGGPYQTSGISDIIGCYDRVFFALEVKVPPNKPTALQENFLARVQAAGGYATWVDSIEKFEIFLQAMRELVDDD